MQNPVDYTTLYDRRFRNVIHGILRTKVYQLEKEFIQREDPIPDFEISDIDDLKLAKRIKYPKLTSTKDSKKYKKRPDVLTIPFYDKKVEGKEEWPKNFDEGLVSKIGEDPHLDRRLPCIRKWRRPLSQEPVRQPWEQTQISKFQRGKSLKEILGEEHVAVLRK